MSRRLKLGAVAFVVVVVAANAIGLFELSEYLGLALVWGALAVTARLPS